VVGGFDPDALLGHIYTLENGAPVRLRLARTSDAVAIRRLLEQRGLGVDEIELARLVHFDPRCRYVICAAGLLGSTETLLGVGGITFGAAVEPDLLVLAEDFASQVGDLLQQALIAAAQRRRPSRAA
jgi:hypothetical protein